MKTLLFYASVLAFILFAAIYLLWDVVRTLKEMGVYSFYSLRLP